MIREVPFDVEGVGLTPEGFYDAAQRAVEQIPEEWDAVTVRPEFERNEDGWPAAYTGAGWLFLKGEKYAAFITETPSPMLDDQFREQYLDKVRHAFERAGAA